MELSYFSKADSCSASLEIFLSWDWKLHSEDPTTEPCPEIS